jgi:hypothetical protein
MGLEAMGKINQYMMLLMIDVFIDLKKIRFLQNFVWILYIFFIEVTVVIIFV